MHNLKTAAMAGLTGLAIIATPAAPASAQIQMPGWFGSLTGFWYPWTGNGDQTHFYDVNGDTGNVRPDQAFGGRAYAGYRFGMYDIAIGGQGAILGRNRIVNSDLDDLDAKQRAYYWLVDGEVGYDGTMNGLGYRLFAGVRYLEYTHKLKGLQFDFYEVRLDERFRGIGPRIGLDLAQRLGMSNFSIFGDISGSYLMGSRRMRVTSFESNATHRAAGNTWNAEGQIGVQYEIANLVNIGIGYRGEYWSNVHARNRGLSDETEVYGDGSRLGHGPFVRVTYNIGAPKAMPVAVVAPPPPPAAVMAKNFIVFFDWDRSDLTGDARKTIADAAATSKTSGVSRINVTGHADRSGSDQYNMALSLRRANNVKDELVRDGVPANQIVVVGRGETQPLVPTADGVREPQNRRVEIVLQ